MEFKLSELRPEVRTALEQFFFETKLEMDNKNMNSVMDLLQAISIEQAKQIIHYISDEWIHKE